MTAKVTVQLGEWKIGHAQDGDGCGDCDCTRTATFAAYDDVYGDVEADGNAIEIEARVWLTEHYDESEQSKDDYLEFALEAEVLLKLEQAMDNGIQLHVSWHKDCASAMRRLDAILPGIVERTRASLEAMTAGVDSDPPCQWLYRDQPDGET